MMPNPFNVTFSEFTPTTMVATALRKTAVSGRLAAAACCAIACLIGAAGCTGGNAEIEPVILAFVEGIKNQDTQGLETAFDWERYYAYTTDGTMNLDEVDPEGVEEQKALLLRVMVTDRGLTIRYRTAEHTIRNISVDENEARAEVLQVDRTSKERRLIKFLLFKSDVWKIYRFSTEELDAD